jgi:hypothetical protein
LGDWMTEVNVLKQKLVVNLEDIAAKGASMTCKKTDNHTADPNSIFFKPMTNQETTRYSALVTDELMMRGLLLIVGSLAVRRKMLEDVLRLEVEIRLFIVRIDHCKDQEAPYSQ